MGRQVILGEGATVALDGQRVLPERTQQAGYAFQYPSLDSALRDIVAT